jgi:hypothetical protein
MVLLFSKTIFYVRREILHTEIEGNKFPLHFEQLWTTKVGGILIRPSFEKEGH